MGNVNVSNQKINPSAFNNFAVPHSRNSTNKKRSRSKVDKGVSNGNMNININLGHQINFGQNQAPLTTSEFFSGNFHNIPLAMPMESFKIPTVDNDEEDFDNIQSIDPQEQKLIEEYIKMKTEMQSE